MRERSKDQGPERRAAGSTVPDIHGAKRRLVRVHPATVLLALSMTVALALLFYLGSGQTFFFDEWGLLLERREWGPTLS